MAAAFTWAPPVVGLALIAVLAGAGMLLVFRATSDQRRLGTLKRSIYACLLELRLYSDEPAVTWRTQGRLLHTNLQYLGLMLRPVLWMALPFTILMVDLDTQKGVPSADEAIRVVGNLATPDGVLAPPDMVRKVGIGTRVRMVFSDVVPGLALPQWTIDEAAPAGKPWRYPQE